MRILKANTQNGAVSAVVEQLGHQNTKGSRHIVIVPDRFSMSVEKQIFEQLNLPGAFNIEVVSFTRLAVKSLQGQAKKALTKEGAVVLLAEASHNVSDLEYFRDLDKKSGLLRDLYAVIASIRTSGISAEELSVAFKAGNDTMAKKYRDIARLYGAYESAVRAQYSDTVTRLQLFLAQLPALSSIAESDVYIAGFQTFSAVELSIIAGLCEHAKSLTVGVVENPLASSEYRTSGALTKLVARFSKADVSYVEKKLSPSAAYLTSALFGYETPPPPKVAFDDVCIFCENTPYDEIIAIGKEVLRLVRGGLRFKDIALVTYDESYPPIISDMFSRLGIPHFIDLKYPLKDTAVARLVLSSLDVVETNYERGSFLAFAKNPILGIQYDEIEHLENYILKYNVNYDRLLKPFVLGEEVEKVKAEATRLEVVKRLIAYENNSKMSDAVQCVLRLFSDTIKQTIDTLWEENEPRLKDVNHQAVERLSEQLSEIIDVTGDRTVSLPEFQRFVSAAIESVDISLIPDLIDGVFVGTGEDSLFCDTKVMFVAGAAAGKLPRESGWQAVMSETDVAIMAVKGLELYPTPIDKLREEKLAVLDLLTKATDRVYISSAGYASDGNKLTASEFLRQAASLLGRTVGKLSSKFAVENGPSAAIDGLACVENAYYELLRHEALGLSPENAAFYRELRQFLQSTEYEDRLRKDRDSAKTEAGVLHKKPMSGRCETSVSRIECFMTCPYKYFMSYELKLKPRDEGKIKVMDVGIILHRVLELFFRRNLESLDKMSDDEAQKAAEAIIDEVLVDPKYVPQEPSAGDRMLMSAIRLEAQSNVVRLLQYIKRGDFRPKWVELGFGFGSDTLKLKVATSSGTVALSGKIDRVDSCGDRVVAIDYKTGKVADYATPAALYYGKTIQLFAYLSVLRKKGLRPVGAYYVPISNNFRKEGSPAMRYAGYTSQLSDDYKALDHNLDAIENPSSDFLPVDIKLAKDGGVDEEKSKNMLGCNGFLFCERYAEHIIASAMDAINEGYAKRRPFDGGCKYCDYKNICFDVVPRRTGSVKLTSEGFYIAQKEDDE